MLVKTLACYRINKQRYRMSALAFVDTKANTTRNPNTTRNRMTRTRARHLPGQALDQLRGNE